MTYTPEERLAIVRLHLAGRSLRDLEREFGCDRKEAADWVRRYRRSGVEGLARKRNVRATYEMRREVVKAHLEKGVTLTELSQKYDISRSTLKSWVSTVRASGYEALRGSKRGRRAGSVGSAGSAGASGASEVSGTSGADGLFGTSNVSDPTYDDLMNENDYLKNELSRVKSLLHATIMAVE